MLSPAEAVAPAAAAPAGSVIRVSRRDLARHQWIWRATGSMTAFLVATSVPLTYLSGSTPPLRLILWIVFFGLVGIHLLTSEPPAIGDARNHLVVALPYLAAGVLFWVSETGPGLAIGASMFIAPLASVRLDRWQHLAAHMAASAVVMTFVGVFLAADTATRLSVLVTVLATNVLAISCWAVLDMAEAQGDELERLVRRDPLTGIGNLRLLNEQLAAEIERHRRTGQPLTVLALDLNGFKALNDSVGHAEGDDLLRDVAAVLDNCIGPEDTIVRQGGDEFCILLPSTTAATGVRMGNTVRAGVAALDRGVTTGVGIATFPDDALDGRAILHLADERLRADKQQGRRRAGDRKEPEAPPLSRVQQLPGG